MANEIKIDIDAGFEYIEHGGERRLLACLPTPRETRARFKEFAEVAPVIPRADWKAVDHRGNFDESYILNQRDKSSCVGFASTGALMRCRALAGQSFQLLSGTFVYAHINGGRDQGSNIGDSLESLKEYGTCLDAECPWDKIYTRQIPPAAFETAKRFKIDEGYRVESFDEGCTAIQLGFTLVYAVQVGRTFNTLDAEDVVGFDAGAGNHAVGACGLYKSDRWGWCIDSFNSWSISFGNRGRFRTPEKHFESVSQDCFAIRVASFDPQNPAQPPIAS